MVKDILLSHWEKIDAADERVRRNRVAKFRRSTELGMKALERERQDAIRAARTAKREF